MTMAGRMNWCVEANSEYWARFGESFELLLKLGIAISPRTVKRYMRRPLPSRPCSSSQTWSTFLRNHARETLACDFFVAVTATFRLVYVFLVLEIGTRRIVHWNVTEQPPDGRVDGAAVQKLPERR
jgi:putative transposase